MSTERILDAELVDEQPSGNQLAVVPVQSVGDGLVLSPETRRLIAAKTPPETYRSFMRFTHGVVTATNEDGRTVRVVGPAAEPWDELNWVAYCARLGVPCGVDGGPPADGVTLSEWTTEMTRRGIGAPSIASALAAVRWLHDLCGHEGHPPRKLASAVLDGYRLLGAAKKVQQATPLTPRVIRRAIDGMAEHRPHTPLLNHRDQLLMVVGVAGFMRRSELIAIRLPDVTVHPEGIEIYLRSSKTDKTAQGEMVFIPKGRHPETCARTLFVAWREILAEHGLTEPTQRVLCSVRLYGQGRTERLIGRPLVGSDVDRAVKRLAALAGEDPDDGWSGHSTRAGGATAAAEAGADLDEIMRQGRWVNANTALRYVRRAGRWTANAAARLDL